MLLIIGAIVFVCCVVLLTGLKRRTRRASALGSMSEQWLAENRASRP